MKRTINKYIIINKVTNTLEREQFCTGWRSWEIHDPDVTEWMINKGQHRLSKKDVKLGLNRNRKPRVEIC